MYKCVLKGEILYISLLICWIALAQKLKTLLLQEWWLLAEGQEKHMEVLFNYICMNSQNLV